MQVPYYYTTVPNSSTFKVICGIDYSLTVPTGQNKHSHTETPTSTKHCVRHHRDKKSNLYSQGVSYLEVQKIEKNTNDHGHDRMPIEAGTTLGASGEVPHPSPQP